MWFGWTYPGSRNQHLGSLHELLQFKTDALHHSILQESPIIMENQMEKNMENEMETLGPFKGVKRDYKVVYRDQGHIMSYSKNS